MTGQKVDIEIDGKIFQAEVWPSKPANPNLIDCPAVIRSLADRQEEAWVRRGQWVYWHGPWRPDTDGDLFQAWIAYKTDRDPSESFFDEAYERTYSAASQDWRARWEYASAFEAAEGLKAHSLRAATLLYGDVATKEAAKLEASPEVGQT